MSWLAQQADVEEISEKDIPFLVRIDLAVVRSSPYVAANTPVKLYRIGVPARGFFIAMTLQANVPARHIEKRVHLVEPVLFWYGSAHANDGLNILCDRIDFPRDLPHENPVGIDFAASPCIAREGLHSLYALGGMSAVLERLAQWFCDAAEGQLDHDGWEPTPIGICAVAKLDLAWFQQQALAGTKSKAGRLVGSTWFVARKDGDAKANHFHLIPKKEISEKLWSIEYQPSNDNGFVKHGPWMLAWGPRSNPISTRFAQSVTDVPTLVDFAAAAGCKDSAAHAIQVLGNQDFQWTFPRVAVLLIGTWRPKPLIATIPGLAEGDGRKLDLSGFAIIASRDAQKKVELSVSTLRLLADATPKNLNQFSGFMDSPRRAVVIGLGALGSKIAEHLVREGCSDLVVADKDIFQAHNVARHALDANAFGFSKVDRFAVLAKSISPEIEITPKNIDITEIPDGQFIEAVTGKEFGTILDCTADVPALRRLAATDVKMKVVRVELAHSGRLGMLSVEGTNRNPRIDDLRAMQPVLALDRDEISDWLRSTDDFSMQIGPGCASASMRMPDSLVSLHAANFMPDIARIVRGSNCAAGIGLAHCDARGRAIGWQWIEIEKFKCLECEYQGQTWQIRVSGAVLEKLSTLLTAAQPDETGGYLYGRADPRIPAIYVTWTSQPPPIASNHFRIQLPPAGTAAEELFAIKRTNGQLELLGTWHTHPKGSANPSPQDVLQFGQIASSYASSGLPHLMLIFGKSGLTCSLMLPPLWGYSKTA